MRKKTIFSFMLASLLMAGMSSCDKTTDGAAAPQGESGTMKVVLGFDQTKTYATSTAKPTTSWQKNIKSVAIFLTDNNGEIKYAQPIEYSGDNNTDQQEKTLTGVPVGSYTAYVFANWDQGDHKDASKATWTVAAAKGRNIADLYMDAMASSDFETDKHQTSEANSKGYDQAPEIFVAKVDNVVIEADKEKAAKFSLTRIVSLFRVRIDQSVNTNENRNNTINFKDDKASLRIRRIKTGTTVTGTTHSNSGVTPENTVFYAKGAFSGENPSADYSQGEVLTDKFTSWKDVILIPAGSKDTSAEKLDVVITGITTDGTYVPAGEESACPAGSQIAWAGAVNAALTANGILEVNLTLQSAGTLVDPTNPDHPVPTPTEYGSLKVQVSLSDWGNIESTSIIM